MGCLSLPSLPYALSAKHSGRREESGRGWDSSAFSSWKYLQRRQQQEHSDIRGHCHTTQQGLDARITKSVLNSQMGGWGVDGRIGVVEVNRGLSTNVK